MESNQLNNHSEYIYPKTHFDEKFSKKTANKNIQTCISNPLISRLNLNSIFIIDQFAYFKYFNSLKNKNLIKLSNNEIIYLKYIYTHLEEKNNLIKANDIIYLDESLYDRINKFNANQKYYTKLSLFLETTILQSDNKAKISCRKFSK